MARVKRRVRRPAAGRHADTDRRAAVGAGAARGRGSAARARSDGRATASTRGRFDVGVISDTHGLVRPEALAALRGVRLILHAGDVCTPDVLTVLEGVAPVLAVRGNNDRAGWARALPRTRDVDLGGARVHLLHDLHDLAVDPAAAGYAAVITGHSHRPRLERRDGVLYLNPGSAGPRRFTLPVSLARVSVGSGALRARIVELISSPTVRRGAA